MKYNIRSDPHIAHSIIVEVFPFSSWSVEPMEDSEDYLEPTAENDPKRPLYGYEYLDHTADVQLHAWGPTLKESFEQCAKAMFGYITELGKL